MKTRVEKNVGFWVALHRPRALRQQLAEAPFLGIEQLVDALRLGLRIAQDFFLGT